MKRDYVISEKDSNEVFGVIKGVDDANVNLTNKSLIRKVSQAIQDQYCYETKPTVGFASIQMLGATIYMEFGCITDDDEVEMREVELNLTAIY